jgi:transcriptional regulator with XRE-family HTH domain
MKSSEKIVSFRLIKYRKRLGYTQALAAELIGVSPSRLSQWEKGERMPSIRNLLRLSILYRVLPDELYFELRQSLVVDIERKIRKLDNSNLPRNRPP